MSSMKSRRTIALAVARKDVSIELNSRILTNQVAPFAAIVMVMFAFALDNEGILLRVAPGLMWLATLFSMLNKPLHVSSFVNANPERGCGSHYIALQSYFSNGTDFKALAFTRIALRRALAPYKNLRAAKL